MQTSKVVLVTGASSGLGRETVSLLPQSGLGVLGTSRKPSGSETRAGVEMVQLDIDSDESVSRCVNTVQEKAGHVDVLVNNAGYVLTGGIEETSIEEAKAQFETNFFGAVRMTKAVLPAMRKRGSGQIVNISSLVAVFSVSLLGDYTAAKAAVLCFFSAPRP